MTVAAAVLTGVLAVVWSLVLTSSASPYQPACDSLASAVAQVESSAAPLVGDGDNITCTTNAECDGFSCYLPLQDNPVVMTAELYPCNDPPAIRLEFLDADTNRTILAREVVDGDSLDASGVTGLPTDLSIQIERVPIGLRIGAQLTFNPPILEPVDLLPPSIIETRDCEAPDESQCQAMDGFLEGVTSPPLFYCDKTEDCLAIFCSGQLQLGPEMIPISTKAFLDGCTQPLSFIISLTDTDGRSYWDHQFFKSERVTIEGDDVVYPDGVSAEMNVGIAPHMGYDPHLNTTIELIVHTPASPSTTFTFVSDGLVPIPRCDDACTSLEDLSLVMGSHPFFGTHEAVCSPNTACDGVVCEMLFHGYVQVTVSTLFFYCEEPIRMVYHLEVPLSDIDFVQNITGSGSVDVSDLMSGTTLDFSMTRSSPDRILVSSTVVSPEGETSIVQDALIIGKKCQRPVDSQQCQAMDGFLEGVTSPPFFYCGKTEDCLAIFCSGQLQLGPEMISISAKAFLDSCTQPLSFIISLTDTDGRSYWDHQFFKSERVTIEGDDVVYPDGVSAEMNVGIAPHVGYDPHLNTTIELIVHTPASPSTTFTFVSDGLVPIPRCDDACTSLEDLSLVMGSHPFFGTHEAVCSPNTACDGVVCEMLFHGYVQVTVSTLFFYCEEPIRMVYHLEVPLSDIDFVQNITGSGSVDVSDLMSGTTLDFSMTRSSPDRILVSSTVVSPEGETSIVQDALIIGKKCQRPVDSQQCQAMDGFLEGVTSPPFFYCGKTEDCLAIFCSGQLQLGPEMIPISAKAFLDSCTQPLSFIISLTDTDGRSYWDHQFFKSERVTIEGDDVVYPDGVSAEMNVGIAPHMGYDPHLNTTIELIVHTPASPSTTFTFVSDGLVPIPRCDDACTSLEDLSLVMGSHPFFGTHEAVCSPNTACDGVVCEMLFHGYVQVTVSTLYFYCEEPIRMVYHLEVPLSDIDFVQNITGSGSVDVSDLMSGTTLDFSMTRSSPDRILVSSTVVSPEGETSIVQDALIIGKKCQRPVDSQQCQAMDGFLEGVTSPPFFYCDKTEDCLAIFCSGQLQLGPEMIPISAKAFLDSCTQPLSFIISLTDTDGRSYWDHQFFKSERVTIEGDDVVYPDGVSAEMNVGIAPHVGYDPHLNTTIELIVHTPASPSTTFTFVSDGLVPIPRCDDACTSLEDLSLVMGSHPFFGTHEAVCSPNTACDGVVCEMLFHGYVQVTVSTLFFYCEEPIRMVYHLEVPLSDIDFVQNITGSGSVDVSDLMSGTTLDFSMTRSSPDRILVSSTVVSPEGETSIVQDALIIGKKCQRPVDSQQCQAMDGFLEGVTSPPFFYCDKTEDCLAIFCSGQLQLGPEMIPISAKAFLDSCTQPLSFIKSLTDTDGRSYWDHQFFKSERVTIEGDDVVYPDGVSAEMNVGIAPHMGYDPHLNTTIELIVHTPASPSTTFTFVSDGLVPIPRCDDACTSLEDLSLVMGSHPFFGTHEAVCSPNTACNGVVCEMLFHGYVQVTVSTLFFYCEEPIRMVYHLEVPLSDIDFVQNITGSGSIDVSDLMSGTTLDFSMTRSSPDRILVSSTVVSPEGETSIVQDALIIGKKCQRPVDSQQCQAMDGFLEGVTSPPFFYCGKTEDCLAIFCSGQLQLGPEMIPISAKAFLDSCTQPLSFIISLTDTDGRSYWDHQFFKSERVTIEGDDVVYPDGVSAEMNVGIAPHMGYDPHLNTTIELIVHTPASPSTTFTFVSDGLVPIPRCDDACTSLEDLSLVMGSHPFFGTHEAVCSPNTACDGVVCEMLFHGYVQVTVSTLFFYCEEPIRMVYHLEVPLSDIDFVQNITGSGSVDVSDLMSGTTLDFSMTRSSPDRILVSSTVVSPEGETSIVQDALIIGKKCPLPGDGTPKPSVEPTKQPDISKPGGGTSKPSVGPTKKPDISKPGGAKPGKGDKAKTSGDFRVELGVSITIALIGIGAVAVPTFLWLRQRKRAPTDELNLVENFKANSEAGSVVGT